MSSADNQQERLKTVGWIVGFVDGEGCFSVSITRNKTTKLGWQVQPEFVVTQGEKSLNSLELIRDFFGCGNVFVNRRYDNHKENLYRYCVRSFNDLTEIIVPFFKQNKLVTSKNATFQKFTKVLGMMKKRKHLSIDGIKEIAEVAKTINSQKTPKFLKSSEAIR